MESSFEWDSQKEILNIAKHGVDFSTAIEVFRDPLRKIFIDEKHSSLENRMYCVGIVQDKIMTVRFVYRGEKVRILGAGYWRKWRKYYENKS